MLKGEFRDVKTSDPAGSTRYVWAICLALTLGTVIGLSAGFLLPDMAGGRQAVAMVTAPVTPAATGLQAPARAAPRVLSPTGSAMIHGSGRNIAENPFLVGALDLQPEALPATKPVTDFLDLPPELIPESVTSIAQSDFVPVEAVNLVRTKPVLPQIAIVMDDLGLDQKSTRRAIALPAEITLSFLPYGIASKGLAEEAIARGHEVMVHIPMEPEGDADPGPNALRTQYSSNLNATLLAGQLDEFPGAVGFNNHMGSRFTADARALLPVMREARARGLLFLDSRTTADTMAAKMAEAVGAKTASRDVFLDHASGADGLLAQLVELEKTARATGRAIAIAHPHTLTLDVLEVWSRGLATKGLELAPITTMTDPMPVVDKDLLAASSL